MISLQTFMKVKKKSRCFFLQKLQVLFLKILKHKLFISSFRSIILYLFTLMISFRKWQFGFSAVNCSCSRYNHCIRYFSFFYTILPFNMEIDQAFIAAILTVIGYSLNDTVIVFDRVREYLD